MKKYFLLLQLLLLTLFALAQNVGIGTLTPVARLHVTDSSVLFSAIGDVPATPGLTPLQGTGRRMMWYPDKAAFRAGYVNGARWDKDNIGLYSFSTGVSTTASGDLSASMGYFTTASGYASTSMGFVSTASGQTSTSMGYNTTASGEASTSMGYYTKAKSSFSLVIGLYNDSTNTNRLFEIGNGTDNNSRRNAMTVLQNGNVGIGTPTPLARLHVKDSSVLFSATGPVPFPANQGDPPVTGEGRRMMWYPAKAAFRAGYVYDTEGDKNNIGNYSTALGYSNEASGDHSFAAGAGNHAQQNAAVALGSLNYATGYNSIAMGNNNHSTNNESIAMGSGNFATGQVSIAMGNGTTASGDLAVAMGENTTASGSASTAMGANSVAAGNLSTAIGGSAIAAADYSISMGESVTANSWISTTLGRHNDPIVASPSSSWILTEPLLIVGNGTGTGDKKNAMAIAKNGSIYIDPSNKNNGTLNGNSLLFGTFNGTAEGIVSKRTPSGNQYGLDLFTGNVNRMSITNAGNVGIGTTAPGFPLNFPDVTGDKISLFGNSGAHYGIGVQGYLMQIHSNEVAADIAFGYGSSSAFTETMRIKGSGKVGIGITTPNAPLAFTNTTGTKISLYEGSANSQYGFAVQSGQLQLYTDAVAAKISFGYYTSGVYTERMYLTNSSGILTVAGTNYPSDARYKKQITRLQNPLEKIMAINGVEYFMRTDEFPTKHFDTNLQVGLIAQEVEKILPQVVQTGEDGYKAIDYAKIVPLLVEGIKEQQKQIDELKKLIQTLLHK